MIKEFYATKKSEWMEEQLKKLGYEVVDNRKYKVLRFFWMPSNGPDKWWKLKKITTYDRRNTANKTR